MNPSKLHYNTVIHQQFRESKIQDVILPLKGHMANQTKSFQAVVQEKVRKWQASGIYETFLKAQIAVFEVFG